MARTTGKRRIGRWVFFAAIVCFLYFVFTGNDGLFSMYGLKTRQEHHRTEIRDLEIEIDSLRSEVARLRNDTTYIERIAREKLGMAREGEKVYKFTEEKD